MIMPCMVMNWRYWFGIDEGECAGKSQLQPHQPRQHQRDQPDGHRRDRVLDGDDFGVLRKDVLRPPAFRMIELDLPHFGRRDVCDCVKRDIDHRNTLLGLLPSGEEFDLTLAADLPRAAFPTSPPDLVRRLRNGASARQFGKRLLLLQPGVIVFLFFDDDLAAHLRVRGAAQLGAENIERSGSDRRDPEIGDHARDHIHLGPELGHIEIVQDVDGAEQHLDRLPDRQVQVVVFE